MAKHGIHSCRNCGAPLGIPDDNDRFSTCRYCGSVLEDVTPPEVRAAGEVRIVVADRVGVDPASLATYAGPGRGIGAVAVASTVVALVIGAVAVLAATGAGPLGGDDPVTPGGASIFSWSTAVSVASDNDSGPDAVGIARSSDGVEIVYLDPDADEPVRWSVDRELEDENFVQFIGTQALVLVASGSELIGIRRGTGAEAWTATLSDAVQPNICRGCVRRFGEVAVTLSIDGVLAGTDVSTGALRWSHRLEATPRQIVDVGGNPAVLDSEGGTTDLRVFSATDGDLLERLPLSCPDTTFGGRETVQIYDHLFALGDGTVLYIADGTFSGCAQRWAAGSGGAPMWEVPYAYADPSGAAPESVVIAGGQVLIADRNVVDVLDLATGAPRRLAERPDAELSPIGLAEGVAVLAERTTRGTSRWSIVGLDVATGDERWRFDPEVPDRIEATRAFAVGDAWTAAMTSAGLAVVQYREEAVELVIQTIPLASGTASSPVTIDLSGRGITDTLTVHGWAGDDLLLTMVGSFIVVDAPSGRIATEVG